MRIHALAPAALASCLLFAGPSLADGAEDAQKAANAYRIDVPAQLKLKAGEKASVRIEVVPNAGDHVSPEAPVSLTAVAPGQLELPKAKLAREDARPTPAQGVEFSLPVAGKDKGQGELKAQLSFYICVQNLCARQKRDLTVPVIVE